MNNSSVLVSLSLIQIIAVTNMMIDIHKKQQAFALEELILEYFLLS